MSGKGQTMQEALRDRLEADVKYYGRMMHLAGNDRRTDDQCHHAGRVKEAESLLEFVGEGDWSAAPPTGTALAVLDMVRELAGAMIGGDNAGLTMWLYKYGPGDRCPKCGTQGPVASEPCRICDWEPT